MIDLKPLPMEEAQQFWRGKVPVSPGEFARLSDAEKVRAFSVSGIAKGDELTTVMQAIQKAIDEGTTLEDFKRDCADIFEKRGWTGKKAWRIDNIFRTNIQTAYNVGRYKQMMAVVDSRPYWRYSAINDSRTRPTHAALNGKVFRADDPFWDTWYPPNGFRCRCGVTTLSDREMRRDGLRAETDDPTGKLIEPIDPKTGAKMLARPLMPDPGFAHNPGKDVWGGLVDAAKQPGNWQTAPGQKTAAQYKRKPLRIRATAAFAEVARKTEFANRSEDKIITDVIAEPVIIPWHDLQSVSSTIAPYVEGTIAEPYEVWLTLERNEDGQMRLVKRYIGPYTVGAKGGWLKCEVVSGVFQGAQDARDVMELENERTGVLLYGKAE